MTDDTGEMSESKVKSDDHSNCLTNLLFVFIFHYILNSSGENNISSCSPVPSIVFQAYYFKMHFTNE